MTPSFDAVIKQLKQLPGVGYRSAERIALHLLVENPRKLPLLIQSLNHAKASISQCEHCGNISEDSLCYICSNPSRNQASLCIVANIPDLHAIEQSGSFDGYYHVLHGKLSPIKGIHPQHLNCDQLEKRIHNKPISEIILALGNDIEGEATCHYIREQLLPDKPLNVTRIAFGLPSGGEVLFADPATLKSAFEGRRSLV